MKLLKFIPFLIFFVSCKSTKLPTPTLEMDALKDVYISKKILTKEIADYELNATLVFNKTYRDTEYGWAGFLLETDKLEGLHGDDQGYIFFIRENGEVGFHSSPRENKEFSEIRTLDNGFKRGESIDLKIIKSNSTLSLFVNGKKIYEYSDYKLKGKYISANAGGVSASIKINSFKAL